MWYACSSTFHFFVVLYFETHASGAIVRCLFFTGRWRCFSPTAEAVASSNNCHSSSRQQGWPHRQLQQQGKPTFEHEKPRPLHCAWAGVKKLWTLASFKQTLRDAQPRTLRCLPRAISTELHRGKPKTGALSCDVGGKQK